MKRALQVAAGVLALVVLAGASIFVVSELGAEVVTLETRDADGAWRETRLWVVDHDGFAWLRSGVPDSAWLVRLEADPKVRVTRGDAARTYRAEPVREPAVRDRIHALVAEKYGWTEAVISRIRDPDRSVAVRLVPDPPEAPGA